MSARRSNLRQRGLSLIELLVALAIGAVLIFGATQLYVDSRNAYTVNEGVARLQETARYAMSIIETDLRMANNWGLLRGSVNISGKAAQTAAVAAVAPAADANVCGTNYAVDLDRPIEGDNNTYQLGADRAAGCDALSGWSASPVLSADTLTVRRASVVATNPLAARLQLCTNRQMGQLISDATVCNDSSPAVAIQDRAGSVNDLLVRAYYIDRRSVGDALTPSLRRKALCGTAGCGIAFIDEEIIPGVEDLQIQFGVESDIAGAPTGNATRYVNPDDALFAAGSNWQIVSVRVWMLVRSDTPEVGLVDGATYAYADRAAATGTTFNLATAASAGNAFVPALSTDDSFGGVKRFRRLLVTRTFHLRNTATTG